MGLITPFFVYTIFIIKTIFMDIKKIIKQELKEATLSDPRSRGTKVKDALMDPYGKFGGSEAEITGDKGAANIAAGEDALDRVKGRLQKLGVYAIPELDGIMTTEQLAIEPFEFDFVLQVPELQEEFNIPKPPKFSTLARVISDSPFILEVKTEGGDTSFTIQFDEKEVVTNLPGTKKSIRALKAESGSNKGKFYNVILSSDLLGVMKKGSDDENGKEEKDVDKEKEGKGGGKVNKETLFNDLNGFFKFVVNNKKFLATKPNPGKTQENIFNEIEELLLEVDVNPTEEKTDDSKGYEGRIYIKDITLGPKAKARRAGDIQNYGSKKGGDSTKWNGLINTLPENGLLANVKLELNDSGLDPEQQSVFNEIKNIIGGTSYNGETKIRKSKKITDNTVFIVEFNNNALVCKINQGVTLKKRQTIDIQPNAAGEDIFDKPIKAKILVS